MKLIEILRRLKAPTQHTQLQWLRAELRERAVRIKLTEACLRELLRDAKVDATSETRLREEIAVRAEFVKVWTQSDARVDASHWRLIDLARKYALPRPWRLSEPVAMPARRPTPIYLRWASAS
jgi:hypothetical protein